MFFTDFTLHINAIINKQTTTRKL